MKNYLKAFFFVLAGAVASLPMTSAWGAIELIGVGSIPGTATDSSGLTDPDRFGLPQNLLGAFGSAIAYTGVGNTYIATPDRGPNDGNSAYLDRYYKFNITVDPVAKTVTPTLLSTVLLTKLTNTLPPLVNFTGNSAAFSPDNLRLDPEGVRMGYNRNIYISDEYGPYVYEFGQNGQILRSLNIPNKFQITAPNANGDTEISTNTVGRVANRGMEGLAITLDGTKLNGIMQSPLIQDTGRNGINNRLLMIDIATGNKKEFVYQLTKNSYGVSEILAINDHQFLVDERDGSGGTSAKFKKLFLIDTTGATDVSLIGTTSANGLPATGLPSGVTAVSKAEFLDLLDPLYGLAGADFPEKIEGLAFGPDLPDGRHLLLITNDNDFNAGTPNFIYAFAIDPGDLPGFQAQAFVPLPGSLLLFGPGLLGLLGWRRLARS